MLKIENVYKTFNAGTVNEKVALQGLNLHLKEGEFVTVIGGNGAGKSTMLNAVTGVFGVDSGKVLIDGVDVTHLPEYKRAKFIGRVFQDPMMGTAATMQIEENLALALRRGKGRTLRSSITIRPHPSHRILMSAPTRVTRHSTLPQGCSLRIITRSPTDSILHRPFRIC